MPRPRVSPSQRRRTAEACNYCREAKKKCSGTVPCGHCLRRGIARQCCIALPPPPPRRPAPAGLDPVPSLNPAPSLQPSSGAAARARREPVPGALQQRTPSRPPASSPLPVAANNVRSRMLLNARGERVYIGGAASLSFLQLVRRVVAEQIGPSPFSHNAQSETMLEKANPLSDNDPGVLEPTSLDMGERVRLSRCFRAVTAGFIDAFKASELEALAAGDPASAANRGPQSRATLGLVLAIGAQAQSPEAARDIGQPCFRRARSRAFEGMLEVPDIDLIRCFLLMAFYLLGDCRRNAAFMYLGIATRAAVALGLHSRDSYADMDDWHDDIRWRIWTSLRIVDMLFNSILGRPAATAGLNSDVGGIIEDKDIAGTDDVTKRLVASHHIVSIINTVVDTLYERKESTAPQVEQLLGDIQAWERELPQCLRSASLVAAGGGSTPHSANIGSVHVSCLYYFAIMLATRPLLISSLTAQPESADEACAHIASACLDAAVFMVQTCVEAREAELLYCNMCIMKALVFAAGLVLGFNLFAKPEADHAIESAFANAQDILSFFATSSPQAAHYHDILTLLARAIAQQRERLVSEGRSRYVSKLLTIYRSDTHREAEGAEQSSNSVENDTPSAMEQWDSWLRGNRTSLEQGEEAFIGWDTLEISHWDSFPFVP